MGTVLRFVRSDSELKQKKPKPIRYAVWLSQNEVECVIRALDDATQYYADFGHIKLSVDMRDTLDQVEREDRRLD